MYKDKISAVYKIVNTVTGEFYIGSSVNVKHRWNDHKCPSTWKAQPNSRLYQDMEKYGIDKFRFQILAPVMPEYLTQAEQVFIELLKPTYNNYSAKGRNTERFKARKKKYNHSDKGKEAQKTYRNRLCIYNGETLTFNALSKRFRRAGISHPTLEAKKYLI